MEDLVLDSGERLNLDRDDMIAELLRFCVDQIALDVGRGPAFATIHQMLEEIETRELEVNGHE